MSVLAVLGCIALALSDLKKPLYRLFGLSEDVHYEYLG